MAWSGFVSGSLACFLLMLARSLHAEEHARLVYVRGAGAEQCPSEVDLRLRVVARLGYDPFSPRASQVVLARIDGSERGLRGSVELVDPQGISSGKRDLTAAIGSCDELGRGLALSISLTIDPERGSPPPRPRKTPEPAAVPALDVPSRPMREQPSGLPPAKQARRKLQTFVAVAFTSSVGALPGTSLGVWAALGLRERHFSVAIEARGLQSLGLALSPRGNLQGRLLGFGVSGCALWNDWSLCPLALLGQQTLETSGVSEQRASSGLLVGVGLRLERRIAFDSGRSALALAVEGVANLSRNGARFADSDVWRSPLVSGHALLGFETSIF